MEEFDRIFYPDTVAVVGASNNPVKAGYHITRTMIDEKFKGMIYPVNAREKEVAGLKCYASILDIKDKLDLIVIVVPAQYVYDVFVEADKRGDVKGAIILTAGFSETGDPKLMDLEDRIVELARKTNIRVFGPNCLGIINFDNNLITGFAPGLKMTQRDIGFVSQSGALGSSVLMLAGEQPIPLGFNKWGHIGNMCDVSNLDLLNYFGQDKRINTIGMYTEGVKDGRQFLKSSREVSAQKPVFLFKVGRTHMSKKAALSHTGNLAGSDNLYKAAFRQGGIVRVENMEEMVDSCKASSMLPRAKGRRVCVLTNAGGPGIIAMDEIEKDRYVQLAPVSQKSIKKLSKVLPSMAMICEPNGYIDMTAAAMEYEHTESLKIVLEDENVDAVVLIAIPPVYLNPVSLAKAIEDALEKYNKPVTICFMRSEIMDEARKYLEERDLPTFDTPDRTTRALINVIKASDNLGIEYPENNIIPEPYPKIKNWVKEHRNPFEHEGLKMLKYYGIKTMKNGFASSVDEAIALAKDIGFPVVMKIVSPDIIHKTESGGIQLNIRNEHEAEAAYFAITGIVKRKFPKAKISGVFVAPYIHEGIEIITGMSVDGQFGQVVMFGLGGVTVELFKDVSFGIAPFDRDEALKMIHETKAAELLAGIRGDKPKDINMVADLLVRISELSVANPEISEIDLNPVKITDDGYYILDTRIII